MSDFGDIRRQILHKIFLVLLFIGVPVVGYGVFEAISLKQYTAAMLYFIFYLPVIFGGIFHRRLNYIIQVIFLIMTLLLVGISNLVAYGFNGAALPILLTLMVLTTMLIGIRWGVVILVISIVSMIIIGTLYTGGVLIFDPILNKVALQWISWITAILVLSMLGLGMILTTGVVQGRLEQQTRELEQSNLQLEEELEQRKKLMQELKIAKGKAEESDRLKTAFLNQISHQIRTPMNGIIGFSEMLSEPDLTPEEREEFLDLLNLSGDQLTGTIEKMIDYALLIRGDHHFQPEEIYLDDFFQELSSHHQKSIQEKGLTLDINGDQRAVFQCDRERLELILNHLIDNSIKFTESGGITITCEELESTIEITIQDTGIGISPELQKQIFEPFQTGRFENIEQYGGNGLGLAIVQQSVRLLGGKIFFESVEGAGTTVTISLPDKIV